MATTRAKPKSGFYIEVTCPGCGGMLQMDSDFFVVTCKFCSSVHRIVMPDVPAAYLVAPKVDRRKAQFNIDRALKSRDLPLTTSGIMLKQMYYPYWYIRGILFRLRNKTYNKVMVEEDRYQNEISYDVDRTEINLSPYTATLAAAGLIEGIPATVGVRPEYIAMMPYSQDNIAADYDSIPPVMSWETVRRQLLTNIDTIGEIDLGSFGNNRTELFHPKASLVYFPYLVFESYGKGGFNRYVVDGVSGRMLTQITEPDAETEESPVEEPEIELGALRVESHRCPNCGLDLPGEQSFVYICRNCHQLVVLDDARRAVSEVHAVAADAFAEDRMFPFWSLTIPADQAPQLKTSFGGIHGSDQLVLPAFRVQNFDALYRLTKRISAAKPTLETRPIESFDSRFLPVSVGPDEATVLAEVMIYRDMAGRDLSRNVQRPGFQPAAISLFYAPFHPESYFYVDSALKAVTFEKSLVT